MNLLLQVVFAGSRNTGQVDLEAIEILIRDSMHRAGATALERLLAMPVPQRSKISCGCGHTAQYHEKRPKQLLTVLGRVRLERSYYLCPDCHQGRSPRAGNWIRRDRVFAWGTPHDGHGR